MIKIIALLIAAALTVGTTIDRATAQDVYVNGYYKSNGTYVQPYMRTAPDNTRSNNFSTQGNTNPYTGQAGTKSPYLYGNGGNNNSLGGNSGGYGSQLGGYGSNCTGLLC